MKEKSKTTVIWINKQTITGGQLLGEKLTQRYNGCLPNQFLAGSKLFEISLLRLSIVGEYVL